MIYILLYDIAIYIYEIGHLYKRYPICLMLKHASKMLGLAS